MADKIHCEVFRITWPDWSAVTQERKENIWEVVKEGVEDGESPSRRSFVGVSRLDDVIAGFFAHEDQRVGVQYDNRWKKQQTTDEEFEHLFFALVLDQGLVVLQRKRVDREFVTINLRVLRREFFDLLGKALLRAGFQSARIGRIPFEETREKSDMLRIFSEYQIIYIRVTGLRGQRVPQDLKLFNPDIDKDTILKQVLVDDFRHMDEMEASAGDHQEGDNLREAKVVRAAMSAGKPQEVHAVIGGQERTFKLTQTEKFEMQLDTPVGEAIRHSDIERLTRIVSAEYFVASSVAESSASLGPLFDHMKEQDENGGR